MRTILLVFVHGFKGDDATFGVFPEHLRGVLSRSLPNVNVKSIIYPQYETRGVLDVAVGRFRNWLQEQVIDIEVENGTPSPMIDPSVHVIIVAHSMGGIVAADTLISMLDDKPICGPSTDDESQQSQGSKDPRLNGEMGELEDAKPFRTDKSKESDDLFLFPYIDGILTFDTPFLGLSPGVFANSAATNFQNARSAYSAFSGAVSAFGWGSSTTQPLARSSTGSTAAALPAAGTAVSSSAGGWQWGKMAMIAGAASGLAATAAAAYINRVEITMGFSWVSSHLEFVSVLMKINELRTRATRASSANGVGIANFYTVLGKSASQSTAASTIKRTFCSLPQAPKSTKAEVKKYGASGTNDIAGEGSSESGDQEKMFEAGEKASVTTADLRDWWHPALNDAAKDEISAHMNMFQMSTNPRYKEMLDQSRRKILDWVGAWGEVNPGLNSGG